MGKLVTPSTYLVGCTTIDLDGMKAYLEASGNTDFINTLAEAREFGVSDGEALCSFYAKLCYASLVLGKNKNISRIRDIKDNVLGCIETAHGSVFEHCQLNFVTTNCSRVFTHEIVRHRVGTAFSQTSGRYVRGDSVDIVFDPILEPVRDEILTLQHKTEAIYGQMVQKMGLDDMKDFARKKKITSALRRMLPNGQSNEIGFSLNLRSLRHLLQLRTSRHSEWEIRLVFGQVYTIVKDRWPLMFHGAKEEMVDDLLEVSGMKMQPYEASEVK